MRKTVWTLLPLIALGVAGCEAPEPPVEEAAEDMAQAVDATATAAAVLAEIQARIDAYEMAAVAGDLPVLKDLWTEDVRLRQPGMDMSGAAEVATFYDETFGGGATIQDIDIRIDEVFVHDDVAYTVGDYEETLTIAEGAEPLSVHNHWFARWERGADGLWRVDRMVVGAVEAPAEM